MKTKLFFLALVTAFLTLIVAGTAVALPSIPTESFAPAEGCSCHGVLQAQWEKSMHAKALTDPLYLAKRNKAEAASAGLSAFCDECHAPIAIMGGENMSNIDALPAQAKGGISCDYCHSVTGVTEPLTNTAQTVLADNIKRAQLKDPAAPHGAEYSEIHTSAKFCGACHNVNHPVNNLPLEATYTEWANGPYAAEGTVCQDCHMTPGVGPNKNPGTAATGGPQRDMIYNMTFAGGNVALGDSELAEERLKGAATLELTVDDIASKDTTVPVTVKLTNSGAGHYLPTGLTETRQMWLVITGTDGSGNETELLRRDFGTVLADDKGNAPVELWEATKIQSDDRIPPKGSITEKVEFKMPTDSTAKVSAALYYRSASEELAKEANVDVPTTTMVSASANVYSSAEVKAAAQKAAEEEKTAEASSTPWILYIAIAILVIAIIAAIAYFVGKKNKEKALGEKLVSPSKSGTEKEARESDNSGVATSDEDNEDK